MKRFQRLLVIPLIVVSLTLTAHKTSAQGNTRVDSHGVEQVWVPAGCFQMGTADTSKLEKPFAAIAEQPQHEVCLTTGYWIDTYEVTQASFQKFVDDGGYTNRAYWSDAGWNWLKASSAKTLPVKCAAIAGPDYPRVCVTWYEAEAYARWRGGRLPTEAEWEYAARGPQSSIYPWGDQFDPAKANIIDSKGLKPVGSYPAGVSWVGAHDMAGNAMEWAQDWFDVNYYKLNIRDNPPGPATGRRKVEKGGWWGSSAFFSRSAYKNTEDPPTYQDHHIGFRIVSAAGTLI